MIYHVNRHGWNFSLKYSNKTKKKAFCTISLQDSIKSKTKFKNNKQHDEIISIEYDVKVTQNAKQIKSSTISAAITYRRRNSIYEIVGLIMPKPIYGFTIKCDWKSIALRAIRIQWYIRITGHLFITRLPSISWCKRKKEKKRYDKMK